MADTPAPGDWAAIATFIVTVVVGIVAGLAGIWKGEERAKRGVADGDPAGLSGGAIFIDSKPMLGIIEELKKIRLALERQARYRENEEEKAEVRRREAMDARLEAALRKLEQSP